MDDLDYDVLLYKYLRKQLFTSNAGVLQSWWGKGGNERGSEGGSEGC